MSGLPDYLHNAALTKLYDTRGVGFYYLFLPEVNHIVDTRLDLFRNFIEIRGRRLTAYVG